ncbi:MAG: cytochrome P450 [Chitinophagaceae bacterium]|nr:cytochrome P450 [Chitinophagaceae bacterium]
MSIATTIDPATWFHRMREEKPLYFDSDISLFLGAKGAWQVFRYEDVRRGLDDFYPKGSPYDPSIHKQGSLPLRALINRAFAPSIVQKLEEWISGYCERTLDALAPAGEMDFIKDFADPLLATVIAQFLGVPESSHPQVIGWTAVFAGDPGTISLETSMKAQREMSELFTGLLSEREKEPWHDMVSHLLQTEIGGDKLSTADLVSFCVGLLLAGAESTDGLLGNAMYTFIEHPEMQEHLRRCPADIPKAVIEVIRLRGPLMAVPRVIEEDQQLDSLHLRKGELVNLWMGSANRDPSVFPEPDTFDINRDNSKMINFGYGIHFCLGNMLSKLETRVALETIFRRMRNIRLVPGAVVTRTPNAGVFRLASLPISFDI